MYAYLQLADLLDLVAARLGDPTFTFWTRVELTIYINDALRTWNSISRMFRDRGSFNTDPTTIFYDLTTVLKNGNNEAFLSRTVTQLQQVTQLKYMLMEPSDSTFTDQFTLTDLTNALTQRTNQFLLETGCSITLSADQVVTAGNGRVSLNDDSIIDIVRAHWKDADNNVSQLVREDEFASMAFSPSWRQNPSLPRRFSVYPDPQLTVQLIPPPDDTGTLSLQTLSAGSLPDDFSPYIVLGALSDLLSKSGSANDPSRASYGQQRFMEGISAARQVTSVMQSYINDRSVTTSSVFDQDRFKPNWMSAKGAPYSIGMLGQNIASAAPAADGIYGITMDSVRNAPLLVNNSDKLQMGREYVDLLIGYVVHLARFKQGWSEVEQSVPQYESFVKAAIDYNNRMQGRNLYFETLTDRELKQGEAQPLRYQVA